MLSGFFEDKSLYRRFLIVVSLVLFSTIIFSMLGALLADALYGINIMKDPTALGDLDNPIVLDALKLMQLISTGIGMFLVPSLLLAMLFSREPAEYLQLHRLNPGHVPLVVIVMFLAVPAINLMLVWNQQLQLPPGLSGLESWMKDSEDNAARITEALLNMHSTGDMLYNLLIIAILPALGEELLFRGILQRLFGELFRNMHWAILITAIIFSAIHMQFYGFLPRMMLGLLFGYLLYWTGSLWVPIIAHLINNGAAVVFAWMATKNDMPFDQDTIGTLEGEWMLVAVSVAILTVCLWQIQRTGYFIDRNF